MDRFNSRRKEKEERISELKERTIEITKSEQHGENRLKNKNE